MKVKELIDMLKSVDENAEIISFNKTTNRWFKTTDKSNYPIETVEKVYNRCGKYAKKQLDNMNKSDVVILI